MFVVALLAAVAFTVVRASVRNPQVTRPSFLLGVAWRGVAESIRMVWYGIAFSSFLLRHKRGPGETMRKRSGRRRLIDGLSLALSVSAPVLSSEYKFSFPLIINHFKNLIANGQ